MSVKMKNIVFVCMTAFFLLGLGIWGILKPDVTESTSERRRLEQFPSLSGETVQNGEFMSKFEKYTLDQFPLRDQFRAVKAMTSLYVLGQKDNNGIYTVDEYASKLEFPMDDESVRHAGECFQNIYNRFLADGNMRVYFTVVPDKNYFMAQANGYPSMDYGMFIERIKEEVKFADYIDITAFLELSDYYSTDTHWRQENILDVARYIAKEMGTMLTSEYTRNRLDVPFYGVYYGQAMLPLPADEFYYLENDILDSCRVYDYETEVYTSVYDFEKINGNDLYEVFLSGAKSLLTIENPAASTNKELILFRDSFGSSIAPLFAEGYSKITLVDIRYISWSMLDRFISFEDQDVLFLYSTTVLNDSITMR